MSGKLDGRNYAGTPKNFQRTHIGYRAHRAVIFAIAWHLVIIPSESSLRIRAFDIRRRELARISSCIYDARTIRVLNAEFVALYKGGRYHYLSSEVV